MLRLHTSEPVVGCLNSVKSPHYGGVFSTVGICWPSVSVDWRFTASFNVYNSVALWREDMEDQLTTMIQDAAPV